MQCERTCRDPLSSHKGEIRTGLKYQALVPALKDFLTLSVKERQAQQAQIPERGDTLLQREGEDATTVWGHFRLGSLGPSGRSTRTPSRDELGTETIDAATGRVAEQSRERQLRAMVGDGPLIAITGRGEAELRGIAYWARNRTISPAVAEELTRAVGLPVWFTTEATLGIYVNYRRSDGEWKLLGVSAQSAGLRSIGEVGLGWYLAGELRKEGVYPEVGRLGSRRVGVYRRGSVELTQGRAACTGGYCWERTAGEGPGLVEILDASRGPAGGAKTVNSAKGIAGAGYNAELDPSGTVMLRTKCQVRPLDGRAATWTELMESEVFMDYGNLLWWASTDGPEPAELGSPNARQPPPPPGAPPPASPPCSPPGSPVGPARRAPPGATTPHAGSTANGATEPGQGLQGERDSTQAESALPRSAQPLPSPEDGRSRQLRRPRVSDQAAAMDNGDWRRLLADGGAVASSATGLQWEYRRSESPPQRQSQPERHDGYRHRHRSRSQSLSPMQPQPQSQPRPLPQPQPQSQPQSRPQSQPRSQPRAHAQPQLQSQPQPQGPRRNGHDSDRVEATTSPLTQPLLSPVELLPTSPMELQSWQLRRRRAMDHATATGSDDWRRLLADGLQWDRIWSRYLGSPPPPQLQPQSQPQARPQPQPQGQPQSRTRLLAQPQPWPRTQPQPPPLAQPQNQTLLQPRTQPQAQGSGSDSRLRFRPQLHAQAQSQPQPHPQPQIQLQPGPDYRPRHRSRSQSPPPPQPQLQHTGGDGPLESQQRDRQQTQNPRCCDEHVD